MTENTPTPEEVDETVADFAAAMDATDEVESFTIGAEGDGEVVTIEVSYPKGRAIAGLRALRYFSEGAPFAALLDSLSSEPSVAEALARTADELGFTDEEGETDGA